MKKYLSTLIVMTTLVLLVTACTATNISSGVGSSASPSSSSGPAQLHWGVQTKTSGCMVHDKFPDPACTPGAIFPNVTQQEVCKSGYSSTVRDVPTSEKDQVFAEYGITQHPEGAYEVDHFISLELGGSNDIANLWPEAASPTPGFHQKDQVENYLHKQVCSGAMSLKDAQVQISTNWLTVYNTMSK